MRASARLSVRDVPDEDLRVYERILPANSLLLDSLEFIPWQEFLPELLSHYSASKDGQPPYPPLILLKLEFLGHLHAMGRRRLIERATYDLHWKFFLGLPIDAILPDHSTLSLFRARIGPEGFTNLFDQLLGVARGYGLVDDELRLKDATHIYADIAVPTAIGLFSQLRDRMLRAVTAYSQVAGDSFQVDLKVVRERTESLSDSERLNARVEIVRDILAWIDEQKPPTEKNKQQAWANLLGVKELAEKILGDLAHPKRGDKTLSVVDPDARRGKHGKFYDGYMLDVMMDPASELITGLDVLPANAAEARNAIALIEAEELAQGNNIEQLSIDAIGFNGEVLRELTDPEGLDLKVFTPPRAFTEKERYSSEQFQLTEDGAHVVCPAGETSNKGYGRSDKPNSTFFDFSRIKCATCALLSACFPEFNPKGKAGRRISKNDFAAEYEHAREVAQSDEYAEVRRRHPAIERKLNEIVRHHQGRRAMYRGRGRVKIQQLLIAMAVNIKRMLKLLGERRAQTEILGAY